MTTSTFKDNIPLHIETLEVLRRLSIYERDEATRKGWDEVADSWRASIDNLDMHINYYNELKGRL